MKRRVRTSLTQALDSISAIQEMITAIGYDFQRYQNERLYRSAIEREFEKLGEAMWRVDESDPDLRYSLPAIGEAIGIRNTIAYHYDTVDDEAVWAVIIEDLDPLRRAIRTALNLPDEEATPPRDGTPV